MQTESIVRAVTHCIKRGHDLCGAEDLEGAEVHPVALADPEKDKAFQGVVITLPDGSKFLVEIS